MADLGFLNFGVGVDGEDLLAKALEKDKQEALEVQRILASLKIPGVQFGNPDAAISKSQQAADKAALSSVKLGDVREKAAASSLLGEQKLQTEIEKTAAIQGKSAAEIAAIEKQTADKAALNQKKIATEAERAAAARSAASNKTKANEASIASMLKEQEAKQRIMSQKLLTEIERTNAAKLRGMKISSEGQVSFNNSAGLTNKTLFDQKNLLNQISNAAGIYFSIYQVGAFVKNLALVSGEFEMQKISLENILQDVDAANKLFGQIKGLSVVSPFEFKDLVGYAKQLSAFSIPVNELYDTTKRLADVSAGLGVDMGRIILAYGQVRSASVLRGCLGIGTPVRMLNGDIKKVEDVVVGDKILGDTYDCRNVKEIIRGREQMYWIRQSNAEDYRVNENHILTLLKDGKVVDIYVHEILKSYNQYKGFRGSDNGIVISNITIEKDVVDDYFGFVIDGNKRFLLGDYTVTHNTELRQFTEAGIPLVDELAKKFSLLEGRVVSAGEVFDKISNRLVPFAMVKDVFTDLTSEGGKFFEMQERQSESLKGKIANLKDAYDIMLYSIGTAKDGILKGGVEGITDLMKNWEVFADALMAVVAAYGVYRTAVILNTVLTKGFTEAVKLSTIALRIHSAVTNATPWGVALSAIAALIGGIVAYTSSVRKSNTELMETIGAINKQTDSVNELIGKLKTLTSETDKDKNAASERALIISKLNNIEPQLAKNIKDHATNLAELTKIQKEYNALIDARKFGEYAIADSNSFLEDGIIEDLDDLYKAQNKLDMSAVRLDTTYTKLRENIKRVNEEGEITTEWGIIKLSKKELSDLNNIMSSSVSNAEKTRLALSALFKSQTTAGKNLFNSIFGQSDIENIQKYTLAINDLTSAEKEAKKEIDYLAELMRVRISNLGIDILDPAQQNGIRNMVKELISNRYGQEQILLKLGIEIEDKNGSSIEDTLDGWRKEIKDIVGNSILIQTDSNIDDTIKDIKSKISDNKKKIENLKPSLIKYGFDFEQMEFPDIKILKPEIQDTLIAMAAGYKTVNAEQEKLIAAQELIGFHQKKEKGDDKDPRVEKLKKEVELIKDAYKEYEKLTKMMSKPLAQKEIKKQDRYKNVDIPIDSDSMTLELKKFYEKAKQLNSKEGIKLADDINKELSAESLDQYTKDYAKIISSIEKEIDKFTENYNFYEKLLGAGEDKQTAIKIAFGVEFTSNEVELGKKLSEIVKAASKKVGLTVDFDINKGDITKQLGDAYNTLTPELKKQIDALEKYRKDKQENTYLEYLSFIQKEVPEGTGVAFDLSSVLTKMKNEVNKIQNEAAELSISSNPLIDKSAIDRTKDLQIKSANDVAANNAKNIGSNFVEQSFKNKMLWEDFKNMGDASYGDIKKMIEEIGRLQTETLSKKGISQIFSTNKLTGAGAKQEDNTAFSPIMQMLGNSSDIDELNAIVIALLENINANKEEGVVIDERISNLNLGQIANLRIILTLIRQMSATLNGAEVKIEANKIKKQVDAFKKLSNSATEVIENVEGLGSAFGAEFDNITKGSLDVVKTIASSSIEIAGTITSFVDASGKSMSLSAMMAGDAIQKVEAASVILAIISAALQVAMKIASIFTGNKTKKADDAIKAQQEQLDDLQRSYDNLGKSADKYYTLNADSTSISKWLASERAAINARYGFLKRFGKMGAKALNEMYEEAEKKANGMLGSSWLQMEQANMEQQKRALEKQIRAAEGDNKKGKRNDEIDGYRNQLKDLDEQLAETKDQWYETLRGFSMQDVANDFAEAWVEAFEKGEDSIDALDKKFNELIKSMIIKQAAMRVVSKIMQPMMDMIDKAIGEDGIITESEVGGIMGALPDTLKKLDDGMNSIIKPLLEKLGITFGSSAEAGEGLSKGIAGVTEDTANLLASYLNAMRADLSNQKIYLQKIIDAIIPMSNNFALQVAELKKIEANTYRTANNTEKNVEVLNEVKAILKSVTTQGSGKKLNV